MLKRLFSVVLVLGLVFMVSDIAVAGNDPSGLQPVGPRTQWMHENGYLKDAEKGPNQAEYVSDPQMSPFAKPAASCVINNWQGPACYRSTGWWCGAETYAVYQDPLEACSATPFDFQVMGVVQAVRAPDGVTHTVNVRAQIYDVYDDGTGCLQPGNKLFEGPIVPRTIGDSYTEIEAGFGTWGLACVDGPYFAAMNYPDYLGCGELHIYMAHETACDPTYPFRPCASYNEWGSGWMDFGSYWTSVIPPGINLVMWSYGFEDPDNDCHAPGICYTESYHCTQPGGYVTTWTMPTSWMDVLFGPGSADINNIPVTRWYTKFSNATPCTLVSAEILMRPEGYGGNPDMNVSIYSTDATGYPVALMHGPVTLAGADLDVGGGTFFYATADFGSPVLPIGDFLVVCEAGPNMAANMYDPDTNPTGDALCFWSDLDGQDPATCTAPFPCRSGVDAVVPGLDFLFCELTAYGYGEFEWRIRANKCCVQPKTEVECEVAPDEWPTYAHDYQRTSASNMGVGVPCDINLVWKRNTTTSNCVYNNVVIADGKVYTSDGERIHCWDLETGNPDWTFEKKGLPNLVTGTSMRANPTIANGYLYSGGGCCGIASFFCIDLAGNFVWSRSYDSRGGGPDDQLCGDNRFGVNVVIGDKIIVCDEGGCVWALSHSGNGDNHPDWGTNNPVVLDGSAIYHSPSWDGGDNLYVATTGGFIYQIDVATGAINWTYAEPDGDPFNTGVVIGPDGVYAHSIGATPQRFKIDAAGGEVWRVDSPGQDYGYGTPTLGRKKVYFPVDHPSSGLLIVNQENGVAEYNFVDDGIGRVVMPATLTCDNYMFISDREGGWHLVDVDGFTKVWSRHFDDYPFGTALATTPGPDETLGTEDDNHYAVMSIWSDYTTAYTYGAVFCWDLDGAPRPMMEILEPELTVSVPLGSTYPFACSVADVIGNQDDCADLNISNFGAYNVNPPTAMKMTPKVSKVSKAHAREAEQTAETMAGADYLAFFDAEGNLTKRGLMAGKSVSVSETPDLALHQREVNYKQAKQRVANLAAEAQTLRTDIPSIVLNPAGPIAGDGSAGLDWDMDPAGLGRGVDVEAITFVHDDPDYIPEANPQPPGEVIVNYVGGCPFEWLSSLFFEYDGTHVEEVSNFGAFGDGTGYGLDWGDGNTPVYDAGVFLLTDGGPYWEADFYDWERSFLPDPAPLGGGICGIDYQDYVALGRSMWFDCPNSPDPGSWPTLNTDYIDVEGEVAWSNYIDTVEASADAYGVKIYQVEIGAYDLDSKYGNFKLVHFMVENRYADPIDDIILGLWFDWDVGDAYSNQGVLNCKAGGYTIHDSLDPTTGFGQLIMPAYLSADNSCEVEVAGYHLLWAINNEWNVWDGNCQAAGGPCCLNPAGDVATSIACMSTGGYFDAPGACGGDADMPAFPGGLNEDMGGVIAFPMFDLGDAERHHLYCAVIGVDVTSNDQATIRDEIGLTSFHANKWAGFNRGDVNDDDCVDACDLAYLDAVINGAGLPIFPHDDNGDVNVDTSTDGADLSYLFDYLMGTGPAPQGAWRFPFMAMIP